MDFIEQLAAAKAVSIEALGDGRGDDWALLVHDPVIVPTLDVYRQFASRDRRRIKRELRKLRDRVKAGDVHSELIEGMSQPAEPFPGNYNLDDLNAAGERIA